MEARGQKCWPGWGFASGWFGSTGHPPSAADWYMQVTAQIISSDPANCYDVGQDIL